MSAGAAGVLAFGDSITNAGGEIQLGQALQSWALWTARGLGVPYTPYAFDGATARDVCALQIPWFEQVNADPDARFDLGTLYVGTNDLHRADWDAGDFSAQLETALSFLAPRCERLICPTIPDRMGRPPNPERISAANAAIRATAAAHGALVLDLADFGARNTMMADHVHPTAFGQVAIAERALALLAADGLLTRVQPTALIRTSADRRDRVLADARYVYRCVRERALQAYWRPRSTAASS